MARLRLMLAVMNWNAKGLSSTVFLAWGLCVSGWAQSGPQITQLNGAQLWQRVEFSVTNVPAATNPFDPDRIRLDAQFTLPSGRTMVVPGCGIRPTSVAFPAVTNT